MLRGYIHGEHTSQVYSNYCPVIPLMQVTIVLVKLAEIVTVAVVFDALR